MDETYFLYLEKGSCTIQGCKSRKRGGISQFRGIIHEQVCVLVARDRTKITFVGLLGRGRIQKTQLNNAIGHKLNDTTVLCTDAWRAFKPTQMKKALLTIVSKQEKNVQKASIIYKM